MPTRRGPVFHSRRKVRVNRRLAAMVATCTVTLVGLHLTGSGGDATTVRTTGAQLISDVSPGTSLPTPGPIEAGAPLASPATTVAPPTTPVVTTAAPTTTLPVSTTAAPTTTSTTIAPTTTAPKPKVTTTTTAKPRATTTTAAPAPTTTTTQAPTTTAAPTTTTTAARAAAPTGVPDGARPLGTFTVTCYVLDGTTASGVPVSEAVAAVDPAVIPLGTRLYIEGVGVRTALDTGRLIKGDVVDVWWPDVSTCRDRQGGTRPGQVWVLP